MAPPPCLTRRFGGSPSPLDDGQSCAQRHAACTIERGEEFVWRQHRKSNFDDHPRQPMDHRNLYERGPHLETQLSLCSERPVKVSLGVGEISSIGAQGSYLADGRVVEPVRTGSSGEPVRQCHPDILSIHKWWRPCPHGKLHGTSLLSWGDTPMQDLCMQADDT